jgi:hypothetical protein
MDRTDRLDEPVGLTPSSLAGEGGTDARSAFVTGEWSVYLRREPSSAFAESTNGAALRAAPLAKAPSPTREEGKRVARAQVA